jgi:hypothetical protein
MKPGNTRSRSSDWIRPGLLAIGCAAWLLLGAGMVLAQEAPPSPSPSAAAAPDSAAAPADATIPPEQLDSLVAPIALYPDALLAQALVASTYPLEIVQLQQWLTKNPGLKDEALAEAVAKQPWDPSVQSMAAIPEVVKRLADDIQWTTDLGNAFLAQQQDVMDAVQRMRAKAKDNGALESNEQQKVETKVVEEKTVIVVESANPEVIYVPTYVPTYVYGPPVYPYPPIYYPPYPPPGAAFVSFSVGFMWGAAWGGSCCGCGWGHNDIYINNSNNFNQINHNGGGSWQHNPQHRGGAPYADQRTASKYGGSTRGGAAGSRQAGVSQQPARQPAGAGNRAGGAGVSTADRGAGGASNRAGGAGVSTADRGAGGAAARPSGGDKVGSRNIPKGSPPKSGGGFSSGGGGYNGNNARASSSRGASSMGSRGGGGGRGRR